MDQSRSVGGVLSLLVHLNADDSVAPCFGNPFASSTVNVVSDEALEIAQLGIDRQAAAEQRSAAPGCLPG